MAGAFVLLGVLEADYLLCLCGLPQAAWGKEGDGIYVHLSH